MKKFLIFAVLALVAGGVYVLFFNKELKSKITEQVAAIIQSDDLQTKSAYDKAFKKVKINEVEEKEGYMAGFSDSLTMTSYQDQSGDSLLLAHEDSDVKALKAVFTPESDTVSKYALEEFTRMFGEGSDFTTNGSKSTDHGDASWTVEDGKVTLIISDKKLAKIAPVKELPQGQRDKLNELEKIIAQKIKMENEWRILDDEKHFCLDQTKFKVITKRMTELKVQAEKLTQVAKETMKDLPMSQVIALKDKLESEP